jgi:Spy/CpxP family protein refolding chaperone
MRTWRQAAALLIAVGTGLAPAGAADSPRDLFDQIIPPELVVAQAEALGLTARQRQEVQRIQAGLRPRMPPLLQRMRQERDALVALLRLEKPGEAAVLAQFERLNAVETELKRLRLQTTVEVKRVLTAEQQARALVLQETQGVRSGAGPASGTLAAKLQRVKEGLEQWKREGRDVAPLRELWERFRAAEDRGHYRQARQALDEAIALLAAPAARP